MLSLPLAKLSVAVDVDPHEHRFTWQHETNDLTFVLDSYGSRGTAQLLKVVQGTQVRQLIELEHLITQADAMTTAMQHRGIRIQAEQLPVSALVRCPLLAIRWQLPNKKIRRAQLRFTSSQDYDFAYSHLSQLGLQMSSPGDSNSRPVARTPSPERTSTASSDSLCNTQPSRSVVGGLSCPPSRLAEVGSRPSVGVNAPISHGSRAHGIECTNTLSARSENRPGTAEDSFSFSGPLTPPVYFARPTSATSEILERNHDPAAFPPQDRLVMEDHEGQLRKPNSDQRPFTADNALPPRRELPFQRSSLTTSPDRDIIRPLSRPSTSTMGPPPLPSRVANLRPSSGRAVSQDTQLPPLPRPTMITDSAIEPIRSPLPAQSTPLRVSHASPNNDADVHREAGSWHALSPISSNKPSLIVAQDCRHSEWANAPVSPPVSEHTMIDPSISSTVPLIEPNGAESLAGYALQPAEDRRAALSEFIFRNLENDEFLALVEDIETCWTTIALRTG